ncbi:GNAT family N-acetyltransferase [Porphyrobacter sp. TH134]|uniref:GNAT family N-acetyltransferase n=1 Tax=Porphyrobacter sp. TH134 TaxID=2067450 RepID=UPI00269DC46C|nr:GNAT family N-acetyltransferase [Porphyrobacter sp. TH134]
MIIAVDGPTASGKGTIAKALAARFGLPHLDTGLLYRAVGRQVQVNGGNPDDPHDALAACEFPDSLLAEDILRSEDVGGFASRVSVHPAVRRALYERQRTFATQASGAVLDGRDIGTVIAPEAEVKLFVTASVAERARRRWLEMTARGIDVPLAEIERDIAARDARDMSRADAPLLAASDALILDTTHFNRDAAIEAAIEAVLTATGGSGAQPAAQTLRIRPYDDSLAPDFRDINAEWIAAMFALEPTDLDVLENPRERIIAPGGDILFIEAPDLGIIGTCALQRTGPGSFELTKMGVREAARGMKAGERLLEAVIARAQVLGAEKLYLLTNHKCAAAIHLYRKLGFEHDAAIMAEHGARYQRCDVAMRYHPPGTRPPA